MNNEGKLVDKNGKTYDVSEFEQKEDGYIYGPSVKLEKDSEGNNVEKKEMGKMAPGIFKEGNDGQLYGPEGQKYGDKESVLGFRKNPGYKRSLNNSRNMTSNDEKSNP